MNIHTDKHTYAKTQILKNKRATNLITTWLFALSELPFTAYISELLTDRWTNGWMDIRLDMDIWTDILTDALRDGLMDGWTLSFRYGEAL